MHLSLAFNPSHLECGEPGRRGPRARQAGPPRRRRAPAACMPLLIHGDAAFMGQGVVAETLNLAGLEGYTHRRHGPRHRQQPDRLHHVPRGRALDALLHRHHAHAPGARLPRERRGSRGGRAGRRSSRSSSASSSATTSSSTCTATAATATTRATSRASRSRCMYAAHRQEADGARGLRASASSSAGSITRRAGRRRSTQRASAALDARARGGAARRLRAGRRRDGRRLGAATRRPRRDVARGADTRVAARRSSSSSTRSTDAARRLQRAPEDRRGSSSSAPRWARGEQPLDWGMAEPLAFGSLARRGRRACASPGRTRAAARSATATRCSSTSRPAQRYTPLAHLATSRARFEVYDSPLSEAGVLGFEFGYSLDYPDGARDLGGAVRRLRERRAGDHRPVHHARGGQVAAPVAASCCSCRTATRARGPSTRARASSASSSCAPRTTSRSAT